VADQKYELLIVIRSELDLSAFQEAVRKVREEIGKFDTAGSSAFGPQSKTAQGAQALTGIQSTLAKASTATGQALKQEGAHTAELADVLRVLSTAARGGADAKRAFNAVSSALPDTTLKEIAASKTFLDVQAKLARALGVTGESTQLFQAAIKAVPGELAQSTAATRISAAAHAELDRRARATSSTLLANTGIYKTLQAAQAETTRATEAFVAGSNLVPAALARGTAAQAAAALAFKRYSVASRETETALKAFRSALGGLDTDTIKSIGNAKGYSEVAGRLALALGLSGEATRSFAGKAKDAAGQLVQSTFASKIASIAQSEYEKRTQGSSEATKKFTLEQKLAAQASAQAANTITRSLITTAATVGNQFLRLGGVTSGFAGQTLGRELLTGIGASVRGLNRLGTEVETAGGRLKRFSSSAPELGKGIESINEEANQAAAGLAAMGLSSGPVVVGIAAVGVAALGTAAAIKGLSSAALAASKAFDVVALRAPKESLEELRALVFEISGKTGIAFEELADAQGRALLKVGGDAQKASQLLRVAADTALAAFTTPSQAVEALGDQLRNYGLEIDKVKDVSNTLLILQRVAKEDFNALAGALGAATPVAKELGFDIKELASTQAGMALAGLNATQAMFGLRTNLANMANPTSAISKEMRFLGVDMSTAANKSRGLRGTFIEMDQALRRTGRSLGEFFGESRKSGPVFAILGTAGEKSVDALNEMRSGADQTKGAIDRLNTPLRDLRNSLTDLQNLVPKVGDAFLTSFSPAIVESIGVVKELAFYFEQIKKKAPEAAEAIAAAGNQVVYQLPYVGKLKRAADLAEESFKILRKALRATADDFGLIPKAVTGPVGDVLKGFVTASVEAFAAFSRLSEKIQKTPGSNVLTDVFRAMPQVAVAAAAAAAEAVAGIQRSLDQTAERATRTIRGVLKDAAIDETVKTQLEKLRTSGGSEALTAFRNLVNIIKESGQAQEVAAAFARTYREESEKTTAQLREQTATFEDFTAALKSAGADTTEVERAFARLTTKEHELIAAQELGERVTAGRRTAITALASEYGLAVEKSAQLQNELRGEYEAYAKRNALLDLAGKATSAATRSVQQLVDEERLVAKAIDDTRSSVLDFREAQRSTLESFERQLARVREKTLALAAITPALEAIGLRGFRPLIKDLEETGDEFEKNIVAPLRTFEGGFGKGIKEFFRDLSASKSGEEAASALADSFREAKSEITALGQAAGKTFDELEVGFERLGPATELAKAQANLKRLNDLVALAAKDTAKASAEVMRLGIGAAGSLANISLLAVLKHSQDVEAELRRVADLAKSVADQKLTGFQGGFDQGIREFLTASASAFDKGKEKSEEFTSSVRTAEDALKSFAESNRTSLENIELELSKINFLAAKAGEQFRETGDVSFDELQKRLEALGLQIEKTFAAPRREGFTAGFKDEMGKFVKSAKEGFEIGADAARQFQGASVDAISNLIISIGKGKNAIKDFAVAMLQAIQQILAKIIAFRIASAIFGAFLGGGGAGSGGGIDLGDGGGVGAGLPPRAQGGPVQKRKPYLIGEKGPELFVPEQDGQVVPYAKTMMALGSAPASAFRADPRKGSRGLLSRFFSSRAAGGSEAAEDPRGGPSIIATSSQSEDLQGGVATRPSAAAGGILSRALGRGRQPRPSPPASLGSRSAGGGLLSLAATISPRVSRAEESPANVPADAAIQRATREGTGAGVSGVGARQERQPGVLSAILSFLRSIASPSPATSARGFGVSLGLGLGPVSGARAATPGGRGGVALADQALARARDSLAAVGSGGLGPGIIPTRRSQPKDEILVLPRLTSVASGVGINPRTSGTIYSDGTQGPLGLGSGSGVSSTESIRGVRGGLAKDWTWSNVSAYATGGIAKGAVAAVLRTSDLAAPKERGGAPRLRLVVDRGGERSEAPRAVRESVLKLLGRSQERGDEGDGLEGRARRAARRGPAAAPETIQAMAKIAASVAVAILPVAAAAFPVRVASAAPASASTTVGPSRGDARSNAVDRIGRAIARARQFADGGAPNLPARVAPPGSSGPGLRRRRRRAGWDSGRHPSPCPRRTGSWRTGPGGAASHGPGTAGRLRRARHYRLRGTHPAATGIRPCAFDPVDHVPSCPCQRRRQPHPAVLRGGVYRTSAFRCRPPRTEAPDPAGAWRGGFRPHRGPEAAGGRHRDRRPGRPYALRSRPRGQDGNRRFPARSPSQRHQGRSGASGGRGREERPRDRPLRQAACLAAGELPAVSSDPRSELDPPLGAAGGPRPSHSPGDRDGACPDRARRSRPLELRQEHPGCRVQPAPLEPDGRTRVPREGRGCPAEVGLHPATDVGAGVRHGRRRYHPLDGDLRRASRDGRGVRPPARPEPWDPGGVQERRRRRPDPERDGASGKLLP